VKPYILAALLGLALCAHAATAQTSGFSQQGVVTRELPDEGFNIAHPSLPLNSKAKIANPATGREVEVTVTRNIRASSNRIADVSPRVYQELGLTPTSSVKIYTQASGKSHLAEAKPQETAPPPASAPAAREEAPALAAAPAPASSQAQSQPQSQPQSVASAPRTSGSGSSGGNTGGGGGGGSDVPGGVHIENNNTWTINGMPGVSSGGTAQAGAPAASYSQPAQPSVTWATPVPAVTFYSPAYTPPAVTYPMETPSQSVTIYETNKPAAPLPWYKSSPPQSNVTTIASIEGTPAQQQMPGINIIEARPQSSQPLAPIVSSSGPLQQLPVSIKIENRPFGAYPQQGIPVVYNQEIKTNTVNEIISPATNSLVYIDTAPESPIPAVTIDNGPQVYKSIVNSE